MKSHRTFESKTSTLQYAFLPPRYQILKPRVSQHSNNMVYMQRLAIFLTTLQMP
jgi:hypothetical protein